jgi:hypothetical protein
MDEESIRRHITGELEGVEVTIASSENGAPEVSWGDTFFICDPHRDLPDQKQFPFATIVTHDYGDFDNLSNLDRDGVFRLNIGVSKETFDRLFPSHEGFDYAVLDRLMPHPVYDVNHWVCVLNPTDATFSEIQPLLQEAYAIARDRADQVHERQ